VASLDQPLADGVAAVRLVALLPVILQSAGAAFDEKGNYEVSKLKGNRALFVAMTMGAKDNNKKEVPRMKTAIGAAHFEEFPFDGGHEWAPQDTFEKAASWVEQQIYAKKDTSPAVKKLLQPGCAQGGK
jgi:hypothetical protein